MRTCAGGLHGCWYGVPAYYLSSDDLKCNSFTLIAHTFCTYKWTNGLSIFYSPRKPRYEPAVDLYPHIHIPHTSNYYIIYATSFVAMLVYMYEFCTIRQMLDSNLVFLGCYGDISIFCVFNPMPVGIRLGDLFPSALTCKCPSDILPSVGSFVLNVLMYFLTYFLSWIKYFVFFAT